MTTYLEAISKLKDNGFVHSDLLEISDAKGVDFFFLVLREEQKIILRCTISTPSSSEKFWKSFSFEQAKNEKILQVSKKIKQSEVVGEFIDLVDDNPLVFILGLKRTHKAIESKIFDSISSLLSKWEDRGLVYFLDRKSYCLTLDISNDEFTPNHLWSLFYSVHRYI